MKPNIKKQEIVVFILCYLAYAAAYLGRANFAIALPKMINEANWSRTVLGSVAGAFFWTYAVGQLVNGFLGDHIAPRILVGIGLAVSALCNLFIYLFPNLKAMGILWLINGFALSALWGPIIRTVSLWFKPEKQSRVALYLSTSMVLGYFLAWGGLGSLLAYKSWRIAFFIPGLVGLIVAILWVLFLPQSESRTSQGVTPKKDKKLDLGLNWGISAFALLIISTLAQGIVKDSISLWGPTLLTEYAGLSVEMAAKGALLIPLATLLGMFLAGFSEKVTSGDDSLSFAFLMVLCGVSLASVRFTPTSNGLIIAVLISIATAFIYGANTVLLTFIPLRLGKGSRVSSIAGFLDFFSYVGSALSGMISGLLIEKSGWNPALTMWLGITILGALAAVGLRKSLKREEANLRETQSM